MVKLKIGSINCQGLSSDTVKRQDILRYWQAYDIAFLIETHCKKDLEMYWRAEWVYEARLSVHTTCSRGTAISFKNSFQFDILKEMPDENGNYLLL